MSPENTLNYVRTKTDDYINLELDTMMYHIMVSEVRDRVYRYHIIVSVVLDKSADDKLDLYFD